MGGKPSVLTTDSDAGSSAPVSVASASESHVGAVPSGGPPPPPTVTSTGPQHTKEQQAAFEAWVTARFDKDTRFIGLENYGNTCYCNSVIQALFNSPLRRAVAEWSDKHKKKKMQAHGENGTLLLSLSALFGKMSSQKKRSGVLGPREFILRMRASNAQFASTAHQDAQEFLIWLLNECNDELNKDAAVVRREEEERERKKSEKKESRSSKPLHAANAVLPSTPSSMSLRTPFSSAFDSLPSITDDGTLSATSRATDVAPPQSILLKRLQELQQQQQQQEQASSTPAPTSHTRRFSLSSPSPTASTLSSPTAASIPAARAAPSTPLPPSLIQHLFEGELTNLTRCLNCGSVSRRSETFFDLSLECEPDISLTYALSRFSSRESMAADEKYSCATCACKQEAIKSLHVSRFPRVLVAHLKRFRYDETEERFTKVNDRVTFPMDIRLRPDLGVHHNSHASGHEGEQEEKHYELTAVVVHIGSGLRHGHYVCLVKVSHQWFCYDDDDIHLWTVEDVKTVFGSAYTGEKNGYLDGYLLFYTQVGIDDERS